MASSAQKGGVAAGILATGLIAGGIFWARQMETEVREGFKGVRSDLQSISLELTRRLDPVLEFKGAANVQLKSLDARIGRLESNASVRR